MIKYNRKIIFIFVMIIMIILLKSNYGYCLEIEEIVDDQINSLDKNEIRNLENLINNENIYKLKIQDEVKKVALEGIRNEDIIEILKKFLNLISAEIANRKYLFVSILTVCIIAGFIKPLTDNFKDKSISDISNFIVFTVITGIVLSSINEIKDLYISIIDKSTNIMNISIPMLVTMLIMSGKIRTAAFFEPITFFIVNAISYFVTKCIEPLIMFLSSLIIINYISKENKFKELIDGTKNIIKIILKCLVGFVLGLSYVSKFTSNVTDGTIKMMFKDSINSLIPVVGTQITSISDIIYNGVNLVKNSFGIVLIVGTIINIVIPIIKILSLIAVYKILSIVTQQFVDDKINDCLKDICDVMSFIMTTIVLILLIYVINITMIFSY